nr:PREDICTED: uncharacterized protein LOC106704186 [Latimeria chalumnae]|eukprot:XP_014346111.1 PREDICTED: uncharacterized protein LOC106704186 [Latimeria chalumnae]
MSLVKSFQLSNVSSIECPCFASIQEIGKNCLINLQFSVRLGIALTLNTFGQFTKGHTCSLHVSGHFLIDSCFIRQYTSKVDELLDCIQFGFTNSDRWSNIWLPRRWLMHYFSLLQTNSKPIAARGSCESVHQLKVLFGMSHKCIVISIQKFLNNLLGDLSQCSQSSEIKRFPVVRNRIPTPA